MAGQIKGSLRLTSGVTVRLVESIPAGPPFTIEQSEGPDAMGVERWRIVGGFSHQDVVDILRAVGYL